MDSYQGADIQPPATDDGKHAHFYNHQQHHLDDHVTQAQHSPEPTNHTDYQYSKKGTHRRNTYWWKDTNLIIFT